VPFPPTPSLSTATQSTLLSAQHLHTLPRHPAPTSLRFTPALLPPTPLRLPAPTSRSSPRLRHLPTLSTLSRHPALTSRSFLPPQLDTPLRHPALTSRSFLPPLPATPLRLLALTSRLFPLHLLVTRSHRAAPSTMEAPPASPVAATLLTLARALLPLLATL
jgi:hypothetical protein